MFVRHRVRVRQHRQRFQRTGGPVERRRIAQHQLVQQRGHALVDFAAQIQAVDQSDLKHPQRAGLLKRQRRVQRLVAGRHLICLVAGQGGDHVHPSTDVARPHRAAGEHSAGLVQRGDGRRRFAQRGQVVGQQNRQRRVQLLRSVRARPGQGRTQRRIDVLLIGQQMRQLPIAERFFHQMPDRRNVVPAYVAVA